MTPCILWKGAKSKNGYGAQNVDGHMRLAHRVAYETQVGPVPEGLELDHLCRNRACINVEHLEAVTHRENCRRGMSPPALNLRKTHCDQGHAFDEANTYIRPGGRTRDCRACARRRRYEGRHAHDRSSA